MSEPTQTLCVLGSQPHRATTGYVCEQHLQRFADVLREIETEYALLSTVPSMQVRSGRGASLKSQRSPAVLDAIVATDRRRGTGHVGSDCSDPWGLDDTASVLDVLHSWARVMREERGLSTPDRITVSGERDLLSRSLSWIAAQAWCDEAYSEIQALLGQLKATNGTAAPKASARCHLPAVNGPCNGPIRVNEVDGYAYCGNCRSVWAADEVPPLLEKIHELSLPRTEDGRAMMTVQQIAVQFGKNAKAVRMRLARYGVAQVDGHYDPAIFEGVA